MTAAVATDLTAGTWAIDPVHSSIGFSVRHLVVSVGVAVRGVAGREAGEAFGQLGDPLSVETPDPPSRNLHCGATLGGQHHPDVADSCSQPRHQRR